ncbi:ROK family protein [Candidatus Aquiluna sp. UB-MaderosW2red]|uniref:ROK family protein n=1 Tax=Candidatus Aquiluna sp. UB-MaderosW2red TaxID=1855377 RepID=UPI000875B92A|nr:ROK family protein [Candidatus Aquiluna sp. UB-MaderosW2red]SCX10008.1 glucokinase [Candidatus Aquiluna sp. UB-MaderosW2red]
MKTGFDQEADKKDPKGCLIYETHKNLKVIAIDVGGTEIKAAVFTGPKQGEVFRVKTLRAEGSKGITARVMKLVADLVALEPEAKAIGIALAGQINEETGVAEASENLYWDNVPFRDMIKAATGLPVGLGHDVRAGGLAEQTLGGLKGVENGLFLAIGTGIAGAMLIQGKLNSHKFGGEIGHLNVGSDRSCACGSSGCLETVATGPSIAQRYFEKSGIQVAGAAEVFEFSKSGDALAGQVWGDAVRSLSLALTSYISVLAPEVIVIGGGVSKAGEGLMGPLRANLESQLVWQKMPLIKASSLGDLATCIGASILAQNAYAAAKG